MIVGTSVKRKDAYLKASGKIKYLDDISFPNMLYGKIITSGVPFAELIGIDISQIPENVLCLTAKDIPGKNEIGVILNDQPFLADKIIRYAYEPIALLAADNKDDLKKAAKKIKILYEEKKPIFHYEDALKKDAPFIHQKGNLAIKYKLRKGNANEVLKKAKYKIVRHFQTPYQEQLYLETMGAIAVPDNDKMVIYGTMQCPFYVRKAVARVLGFPLSKIRVIQTPTGGGFGGKEDVPNEICAAAALLAYYTNRPVKVVYERTEDICRTSKRHPMYMRYEYGFDENGKILAAKAEVCADIGAYATLSPAVLFRSFAHVFGPYKISNAYADVFGIYTNNQPAGAFRGFGTPQVVFAHESMMDEIAKFLNIDPWQIRKINIINSGDETITGQKLTESVGLSETLEKIKPYYEELKKEKEEFNRKNKEKVRGLGLSTIYYGNGLGVAGKALDASGSFVQVNVDGSVFISVGCVEMGQGALTVLSQIAAETLGFPYENIYPNFYVDTCLVQDSGPTVASRTTVMSGNALIDACKKIKERILKTAVKLLNENNSQEYILKDIDLKNGIFYHKGEKIDTLSLDEVLNQCFIDHVKLAETGWYEVPDTNLDFETGLGSTYYVFCFATQLAYLEVDKITGEVNVLKVISAHDVGKCINPTTLKGQIYGGVVQGMGYALFENLIMKNGKFLNPNLTDYIVPTIKDIPEIIPIIVEAASKDGPYGAKGIGEPSLIPAAASFSNAVCDAIGKRIYSLPVLPEKILEVLNEE